MDKLNDHVKFGFDIAEKIGIIPARTLLSLFAFALAHSMISQNDSEKAFMLVMAIMAQVFQLYDSVGICKEEYAKQTCLDCMSICEGDNIEQKMGEILRELTLASINKN